MDLSANRELIYAHEKRFAEKLASHVLKKPTLNAWMVLIPFIFVFYFIDFSKYKTQRNTFVHNWLLSRKKALDEAVEAVQAQRTPNVIPIAESYQGELGKKGVKEFECLLDVMSRHYVRLLSVRGNRYDTLVKTAYQDLPGEYRHFLNQLAAAEHALNSALLPQLKKTVEGVKGTIKQIEEGAAALRSREIDELFTR